MRPKLGPMNLAAPLRRAFRIAVLAMSGAAPFSHAEPPADCPPAATELTPEQVSVGMSQARDRGFLWRITKDGHDSYLYGTVHVAKLEWMFPGPRIVEALEASDTIALELDLLDPQTRQELVDAMTEPPRFSLPPQLVERVQKQMTAECIAPQAWASLGPELHIASLTAISARRDGLDPAYSIDLMLSGYGHRAAKRVLSLETAGGQLKALQLPTREATLAWVESGLDDLESGRSRPLLNRISGIWAAGDLGELARYDEWCECRKTATDREAMERLLDDRNPGLADRIDDLHASGRHVFAAVGSLHMVGPVGLPALMMKRGYKVEVNVFER